MKRIFLIFPLIIASFLAYSQQEITISKITIIGNKITNGNIILREIVLSKDSSIDASLLEEKINRLMDGLPIN